MGTATVGGGVFSVDIALAAGVHHLRAFQADVAGNVGANSTALDVTITTDTTAPDAPTGLDLAAADDSGISDSDNVTANTSALTISGAGENGATVTLFDDADNNGVQNGGEAALGTATVGGGVFSVDIALAGGVHHLRAFQTDIAGNVGTNSTA